MLPNVPWKQEPVVQQGWERLIREIEARTGEASDGDTLEEKMEYYDAKIHARGLSALGSHVDLTLAFLLSTGRLCLAQLHEVVLSEPGAACYFGDPEVASVEMLALCAQTAFDPLAVSAVQGYAAMGYDPDSSTLRGDRLVHLAAESGRLEMTKALLVLGADPNARDASGNTALHRVLASELPALLMRDTAKTLIRCGASTKAVNLSGMSVENLLVSMGWNQMAQVGTLTLPCPGSLRLS